ncbi:MAG: hypothetical protein DMG71_07385 [Acidobacteria bacterium]|nr:MAG: hypothetical protein DMG71_07385 [Acidobacteriota bacterium]
MVERPHATTEIGALRAAAENTRLQSPTKMDHQPPDAKTAQRYNQGVFQPPEPNSARFVKPQPQSGGLH